MTLYLHKSILQNDQNLHLTGSKSETNRILLLQSLYPNIQIDNASVSDDSEMMSKAIAIHSTNSGNNFVDIHHAGTAMRFLTAYFAIQKDRKTVLTGSERMKQRPISILVEALRQLGAEIHYLENEGFPPLEICGKNLTNGKVQISSSVSSQYISALLLIAPKLESGIEIQLEGEITSLPYIKMTLALLNKIGVNTSFLDNKIIVKPLANATPQHKLVAESDWSSASYYYSFIALSPIGTSIALNSFGQNSLQADSALVSIYSAFGVETIFKNEAIIITKIKEHQQPIFPEGLDCTNCPDIAQTIAVTAFGLGTTIHLTGLHTLKIKETDRILALETELSKFGAKISVSNNSLTIQKHDLSIFEADDCVTVSTYQDHRMAMAFAPLALKTHLKIENANVVSKSYPTFWEDLKSIGLAITTEKV